MPADTAHPHTGFKVANCDLERRGAFTSSGSRLFLHEPQPDQVILGPTGLRPDHRFQGFEGKCVPSSVRRDRHAPAVRVALTLMRSALADEIKTIAREGGDEFSGRE